MTFRHKRTAPEAAIDGGREDFGVRDQKGRAVGYRWTIFRVETRPVKEGEPIVGSYSILPFPDASHFAIRTHATRDGSSFGALTRDILSPDLDAAKAELSKRIAGARKRYTKQFGHS